MWWSTLGICTFLQPRTHINRNLQKRTAKAHSRTKQIFILHRIPENDSHSTVERGGMGFVSCQHIAPFSAGYGNFVRNALPWWRQSQRKKEDSEGSFFLLLLTARNSWTVFGQISDPRVCVCKPQRVWKLIQQSIFHMESAFRTFIPRTPVQHQNQTERGKKKLSSHSFPLHLSEFYIPSYLNLA